MDLTHVLLGLALALNLYLVALTVDRVRRLSGQVAVLTIRVTDLVEALDAVIEEQHG